MKRLVKYDAACRALTEARSVDEVKDIRDKAIAMAAYARQAKNRDLEADAVEIRLRAERRAGELLTEMEKNQGAVAGKTGCKGRPVLDSKPKLADFGVSKTQSSRWQALASIPQDKFASVVADACGKVDRALRNAVREVEIEQERESYRARTETGCTVADLETLAASGQKFGVICPDFPWLFKAYSSKGKQSSAERNYETWPPERILTMAPTIKHLAAPDCVLLLWAVWTRLPDAIELIEACGFEYKTNGFLWLKTTPNAEVIKLDGKGLHYGNSLSGTCANTEPVLLGTHGSPQRLSKDVHQVIIAPVGAHSAKPDEAYRRMERLYAGPRLELFARKAREGWITWGNEIQRAEFREAAE